MAKNYFKLLMVTLSLALFAGFMSCNTEDVDYVPAEISVMPSVIEFEAGVTTPPNPIVFDVEASRGWTAEFSNETVKDWLSLSVMKGGSGTTTITAMALPNTAELPRGATVKFSIAGSAYTTLNVTQKGTKEIEPIGDLILKESFGEGATKPDPGQWPTVAEWTGYLKEGSGATNVAYTGASSSIRVSTPSTDYPGATGKNNLFFGALPNDFVVSKIDVTGKTKLTFKFGVSAVGVHPAMEAITASTIKLQGSLDGTAWTDLTFTNANTVGWVLATSEFEVPAGSTELYIKFSEAKNSLNVGSVVRVDDMELNVGTIGGIVIGGGGPGPEPTDYIYGESFGVPTANTAISAWAGWVTTGTGKANVSYTGSNTTIRKSLPSTGYEGATGEGCVFFAAAPSHFTVAKIGVTGETKLTLKFGISDNSGAAPTYMLPVSATTVKVQGSLDGVGWTPLTYTNSTDPAWVIATVEFQVPAGSTELYLKFEDGLGVGGVGSKVRIDDIILSKGTVGGTEIGAALPEVAKTIADLRAMPAGKITENIYVTGFVIGQTNSASQSNLIIQDATGGIMFRETSFGDFTIFAEGDEVKVKLGNANMTEYQGLKQVGLLVAAVSKTGTNTAQTPKAITAAELITGSHESQLVSVADVQVIAADLSKTMDGVIDMESLTGETFGMYTSTNAAFKDAPVPTGSGTLSGVASVNSGVYQIIPQATTHYEGLTGTRFGILTFGAIELDIPIKQGDALTGNKLMIPYTNSMGTETYSVTLEVAGVGAAGIDPITVAIPVTLAQYSGTLEIPLTGTPTATGEVTFTVVGIAELGANTLTTDVAPSGSASAFTAKWDMMGGPDWGLDLMPAAVDPATASLTVGGLTKNNFTTSGSSGNNNWGGTDFSGNLIENELTAPVKYATIDFTSTEVLSLTGMSMTSRMTKVGPLRISIQYSIDGGAFAEAAVLTYERKTSTTTYPIEIMDFTTVAGLQNIDAGKAVTIRIVPVKTGDTTMGNWYISGADGLSISGSVK